MLRGGAIRKGFAEYLCEKNTGESHTSRSVRPKKSSVVRFANRRAIHTPINPELAHCQ